MAMVDPKIKSVIIYLNTPGGLAFACIEISRYVSELAKIKPVIAVIGAQRASGGYLIASFASVMYTHQNTITGVSARAMHHYIVSLVHPLVRKLL